VKNLIPAQLAGLELRLSELVHPEWLTLAAVNATDVKTQADRTVGFSVALSRYLIEEHKLSPLDSAMFPHDWTYAVLGGHNAVQAISSQLTTYLITSCVHRLIGGVQVRALHVQLGKEIYEQALRSQQPLQHWTVPNEIAPNLVQYLTEKTQILLEALWLRESPLLLSWVALMSPLKHQSSDRSLIFAEEKFVSQFTPSFELLDEINQRFLVDFKTDITGILGNSSLLKISSVSDTE
jgi:hypothetical protein